MRDDYRRGGLGSALAAAVTEVAREPPVSKLILEIVEEQLAGRLIFSRLGFRLEGLLEDHAVDYLGTRGTWCCSGTRCRWRTDEHP